MLAGYAVIPLYEKRPPQCVTSWQHIPPVDQWRLADQSAGGAWRGNLGIIAGGGIAFVDCDSPQSVENMRALLADLAGPTRTGRPARYAAYADTTAPRVRTAHGGLHVYIRVKDVPTGFNWATLPAEIGSGELRVRNCYVVAPPSALSDGTRYKWQQGKPEHINDLPAIAWADLISMGLVKAGTLTDAQLPDVPLLWRPAPAFAVDLAGILHTASPGQRVLGYASRSEAEASIVAHLILAGWSLPEIERFFEQHLPGTYADKPASQRQAYLQLTYSNVLAVLKADPDRAMLGQLYEQANRAAWPGRSGATDKRAYQAILSLGWPAGKLTLAAASRDIAQLAAIDDQTARMARRRLTEAGLLDYLGMATVDGRPDYGKASWYRITGRLPAPAADSSGNSTTTSGGLEVWSWRKLGHSAELVYRHLPEQATASVADLARVTGKAPRTVKAALYTLAHYELASHNGKTNRGSRWGRGPASLQSVARQLEAPAAATARRNRIEREREAYEAHRHRAQRRVDGDGDGQQQRTTTSSARAAHGQRTDTRPASAHLPDSGEAPASGDLPDSAPPAHLLHHRAAGGWCAPPSPPVNPRHPRPKACDCMGGFCTLSRPVGWRFWGALREERGKARDVASSKTDRDYYGGFLHSKTAIRGDEGPGQDSLGVWFMGTTGKRLQRLQQAGLTVGAGWLVCVDRQGKRFYWKHGRVIALADRGTRYGEHKAA